MPVTAKLSRKFYERFGDDLTNELVEWFNQVDATYRSEFRDLFEVHFSRFDAKLEQRVAELLADVRAELHTEIGGVSGKFDSKLSAVETKFGALESKFGALESKFGALELKLGAFESQVSAVETRLIRWMFLFWVGTLGTLVALLKL